jgi:hypothetical protein
MDVRTYAVMGAILSLSTRRDAKGTQPVNLALDDPPDV